MPCAGVGAAQSGRMPLPDLFARRRRLAASYPCALHTPPLASPPRPRAQTDIALIAQLQEQFAQARLAEHRRKVRRGSVAGGGGLDLAAAAAAAVAATASRDRADAAGGAEGPTLGTAVSGELPGRSVDGKLSAVRGGARMRLLGHARARPRARRPSGMRVRICMRVGMPLHSCAWTCTPAGGPAHRGRRRTGGRTGGRTASSQ